jgi:uncharacterized phage-associated protein
MPDEHKRLLVGPACPRGDAAMAHIQDVAAYILKLYGGMTAMKLQKLCYYCYGYHLAWEERPLFQERFQAWANGPVCAELYRLQHGRFQLESGDLPGQPAVLDSGESESVDLVLSAYGGLTAHQLSSMTHSELAWVRARQRAGAVDLDSSTEVLLDEDIFEYFDALTSVTADGPEE